MTRKGKGWIGAGVATAGVALLIGCGGSGEVASTGRSGLRPDVRILPSDGRYLVTAIGERGLRLAGPPMDNVRPGDLLVVCAPITDQARAQIGHRGGYLRLTNGMHLVPSRLLPLRFRARSATTSHVLIALERVGKTRAWDASGRIVSGGSVAYGTSTGSSSRGFLHSIFHAVSHAASQATNAVTNAATDVGSAVTNAATDVGSEVTSLNAANNQTQAEVSNETAQTSTDAATDAASDATSAASSLNQAATQQALSGDQALANAETAVANAVTSAIGPITKDIVTEIEAVGADLAELWDGQTISLSFDALSDVDSVTVDPDVPQSAISVSKPNDELIINLNGLQIGAADGAFVAINGQVAVKAGFSANFHLGNKFVNSVDGQLRGGVSTQVTVSAGAQLTKQWAEITLQPIVIPAGEVPIVVVPVIAGKTVVGGQFDAVTLSGSAAGVYGFQAGASGGTLVPVGVSSQESGSVTPPLTGGVNLNPVGITLTFNLYDLAGPYFEFDPAQISYSQGGSGGTVSMAVDVAAGINLDPLGFKGWSAGGDLYEYTYLTQPFGTPTGRVRF